MTGGDNWQTQQLTAFLAAISDAKDRDEAIRRALEQAAEAVDAEIGAILLGSEIVCSIGFRQNAVPVHRLNEIIAGSTSTLDSSGVAVTDTMVLTIDGDQPMSLVLGRCDNEPFTLDEGTLLRGMARVVTLSLSSLAALHRERSLRSEQDRQAVEMSHLVDKLQDRQALLEGLSGVQRLINRRVPLQEVLDAICLLAQRLLKADLAFLVMVDNGDFESARLGAISTHLDDVAWRSWRVPAGPATRTAMRESRVLIDSEFSSPVSALDGTQATPFPHLKTAIAAPVYQGGAAAGALLVTHKDQNWIHSSHDVEVLEALSEHVSLVLNDAKTVADMYRALHDPLTGLPSRSLFLDMVDEAIGEWSSVAVLFIDLDGFKRVNDTLGHTAGDLLLSAVAHRISDCVGDFGVTARIGGDEFSLLVQGEHTEVAALDTLAARITEALTKPFTVLGHELFIGASIGIASKGPRSRNSEELLRDADVAMYAAKDEESGCVVHFREEMYQHLVDALAAEVELRAALANNEFVLVYQPVLSLTSQRITGFEALIRWNHPRRGRLTPDKFIGLAEHNRLIVQIDQWVLGEACRQLAVWRRHFDRSLSMAVNISAHGLLHEGFLDNARRVIAESGIDPSSIVIELTETALVRDLDTVAAQLHDLKTLGVTLAIDDFGTGYSSVTHLYRFPFDVLKIDRSFVSGLLQDSVKGNLVRGLIGLGKQLGLQTVAEGIEAEAELNQLAEIGCEFAQGFFIDRPLEPADAQARLVQQNEHHQRSTDVNDRAPSKSI